MRATFWIAAGALLAGVLAVGPSFAQSPYGALRAQTETTETPPAPRPAPPNLLSQGVKPPVRPESSRVAPAQRAECSWIGKRMILVLLRDDLIATKGFLEIYTSFGCPIQHVGQAFGCSTPAAGQSQANDMKAWVDACWDNPDIKPLRTTPEEQPKSSGTGGNNAARPGTGTGSGAAGGGGNSNRSESQPK
jgi:hypothetical protein